MHLVCNCDGAGHGEFVLPVIQCENSDIVGTIGQNCCIQVAVGVIRLSHEGIGRRVVKYPIVVVEYALVGSAVVGKSLLVDIAKCAFQIIICEPWSGEPVLLKKRI